jgi:hypothetical protein
MIKKKTIFSGTNIVFLLTGILILALCLKTMGIKPIIENIITLGRQFWIIVGIHIISNTMLTLGWWILFPVKLKWSHFPKFLAARIAGDSTTFISSVGALAGEPLKALYIKEIVPMKTGLATVFLDRTIHTISNILIVLTGIIASIFILKLPAAVTIISLASMIGIFIILLLVLKKQSEGILEYIIIKMPGFITRKFITEERMKNIRTLDDELRLIMNNRKKRKPIAACLLLHYFGILIIATLEIYLIVKFINPALGFTITDALFLYIFGFILTTAAFFVPANIGVSEGSYAFGLYILGFPGSLGVSIGFIRRLRTLVWTIIGLLLMFHAGIKKKKVQS